MSDSDSGYSEGWDEYESLNGDFAMRILKRTIAYIKGDDVPFSHPDDGSFDLFNCGGSGQRYSSDHVELMRELLSLGGTIKITGSINKGGWSSLMMGAYHKDYEFVTFLMEHGADVKHTDRQGKTVFDYADQRCIYIIFAAKR